jgi:alkylation response protein AidB-like acyl-CoA dehydrogenase
MGIEVPAEYGGAGMDPICLCAGDDRDRAADCAHSTIMSVNNSLYCNGILKHGSEAQKQKYVRAIASGERDRRLRADRAAVRLGCFGDACSALKQADGDWVINGKKSWITSGPVARYIMLFAMTDAGQSAPRAFPPSSSILEAGFHARQDRAQARHPRLGHLRDRVRRLRVPAADMLGSARARASRLPWACSTPAASASPRKRSVCARAAYEASVPTCANARPSARRSVRSR